MNGKIFNGGEEGADEILGHDACFRPRIWGSCEQCAKDFGEVSLTPRFSGLRDALLSPKTVSTVSRVAFEPLSAYTSPKLSEELKLHVE
jgi:hypothetical protein